MDVWANGGPVVLKSEAHQAIEIVRPRPGIDTERCLEHFDLSIVQQGYFSDSKVGYCTALALYTWHWKEILAIPSRECIEYEGFIGSSGQFNQTVITRDIWFFINVHCINDPHDPYQHNGEYHECVRCGDYHNMSAGHIPFQRWRKRMRAYAARFPEFNIVYCPGS
jgi:hypothetical protein